MDIFETCQKKLVDLGLVDDRHEKRLRLEFREIAIKKENAYFIDLYNRRVRFPRNEHNLLVPYLLGLCPDFDIEHEPAYIQIGDMPDIDIDYIDVCQSYLKNVWAPKTFGADHVCNISNYTTFGIKSALTDMARVFGLPQEEIKALTTRLGLKDDEGKLLTWDKAMSMYPELKQYCDDHPDVADAAKRLLHRNRGKGVHAGGLIISSIPLTDLVPLIRDKDNPQASAWVEGLHGKDLQPVGLIKFDVLVIANLRQIALCCKLIKERHGLEHIMALPDMDDWSDTSYLNDPEAIQMANDGDLKCIFQFDSDGMRALAKSGGVDCFDDLVAYISLYRPGPMQLGMHERYIIRKKGREKYHLHELLEPILGGTHGVMIYQEELMKILNVVGGIPLEDCEIVRSAISKKKVEYFEKYKSQFLVEGQKRLGADLNEVAKLWDQIEAFAEYGFNLSHAVAYTYIASQLLYLKAHFPHEFYSSILACEDDVDKIKEYRIEALAHKVAVEPPDINKSGVNFDLVGQSIYYGFSNVKGVGTAAAQKIVDNRPYRGFEDFLARFGTQANTVRALIGLRVFRDRDPVTLYKYVEYCKEFKKNQNARKKGFEKSQAKLQAKLLELCLGNEEVAKFEQPYVDVWRERFQGETVEVWRKRKGEKVMVLVNRFEELQKLYNRCQKSRLKFQQGKVLLTLDGFNPDDVMLPDDLIEELRDRRKCQERYFGFLWDSQVQDSPDFSGKAFDIFQTPVPSGMELVAPVEVEVLGVQKKYGKTGKHYYQAVVMDCMGRDVRVNIWSDDWERFGPDFKKGNLLRLRLKPPGNPQWPYALDSTPRWKRQTTPARKDDVRVMLMRHGEKEEEVITGSEALVQIVKDLEKL